MSSKALERAAYIAAHRILEARMTPTELVCPGARRSHAVDTIAGIIRDAIEQQGSTPGDFADFLESRTATSVLNRSRTGLRLWWKSFN